MQALQQIYKYILRQSGHIKKAPAGMELVRATGDGSRPQVISVSLAGVDQVSINGVAYSAVPDEIRKRLALCLREVEDDPADGPRPDPRRNSTSTLT